MLPVQEMKPHASKPGCMYSLQQHMKRHLNPNQQISQGTSSGLPACWPLIKSLRTE